MISSKVDREWLGDLPKDSDDEGGRDNRLPKQAYS